MKANWDFGIAAWSFVIALFLGIGIGASGKTGFFGWLHEWQTLVTGIMAIAAATAAYRISQRQIAQTARQHAQTINENKAIEIASALDRVHEDNNSLMIWWVQKNEALKRDKRIEPPAWYPEEPAKPALEPSAAVWPQPIRASVRNMENLNLTRHMVLRNLIGDDEISEGYVEAHREQMFKFRCELEFAKRYVETLRDSDNTSPNPEPVDEHVLALIGMQWGFTRQQVTEEFDGIYARSRQL